MIRRYNFKDTMNTRDLGGYPSSFGGYTKYNSFLRSDIPHSLTADETEMLLLRKITTIIDLRSNIEASTRPCFFSHADGFAYHHIPLSEDGKFPQSEDDVPVSYFEMLALRDSMLHIMTTLANADGGVLFHCSAGKDRTGVVAALLLTLAGVPFADILADYQVSSTYIQGTINELIKSDTSFPAWLGLSKPEYLSVFFDLFYQKYHSVEDYLAHIGLSQADICKIRDKLL